MPITDLFTEVGLPGSATTLSAPGKAIAAGSINVGSTASWPANGKTVFFALRTVNPTTVSPTNPSGLVAGTYTEWKGIVATNSVTSLTLQFGTDQVYTAGSNTQVFIPLQASRHNAMVTGLTAQHTQLGAHTGITTDTVVASGAITAASFVQTGGSGTNGYSVGLNAPNTVTANGNRSYAMVFNGVDYSGTLSAGMRLRSTRTVAAPTQCTSLNGTTQYFSKTSPAGMTFTDDFVVSAWVKLTSYPTGNGAIASRWNGTSGWLFYITSAGIVKIEATNAGGANFSNVASYQSVPLNKWTHISAQLDMSAFTATPTTSYTMIDGIDVPAVVTRGGTNPTTLIQAGNLEIGTYNAGSFFPGKIAQVAIYSAKVTQATILASMNQGLLGTETSLISAYSFNGNGNDLNTTNANNLTANAGATATNADAPFGGQADGSISSTLDYGIVQRVVFSTNTTVTVQVPEGCTIPTSGGVSAVVYSSNKVPYGFVAARGKWIIQTLKIASETVSIGAITTWTASNHKLTIPAGEWIRGHHTSAVQTSTVSGVRRFLVNVSDTTPTNSTSSLSGYSEANSTDSYIQVDASEPYSVSTPTVSTFYGYIVTATGVESYILANRASCSIYAENALL